MILRLLSTWPSQSVNPSSQSDKCLERYPYRLISISYADPLFRTRGAQVRALQRRPAQQIENSALRFVYSASNGSSQA
jgi:hypothetical protein